MGKNLIFALFTHWKWQRFHCLVSLQDPLIDKQKHLAPLQKEISLFVFTQWCLMRARDQWLLFPCTSYTLTFIKTKPKLFLKWVLVLNSLNWSEIKVNINCDKQWNQFQKFLWSVAVTQGPNVAKRHTIHDFLGLSICEHTKKYAYVLCKGSSLEIWHSTYTNWDKKYNILLKRWVHWNIMFLIVWQRCMTQRCF